MASGSGAGQAYAAIPPGRAPRCAHVSLVAHCLALPHPVLPCPALTCHWPTLPSVVSGGAMPSRLVVSCRAGCTRRSKQERLEERKEEKEETWELTWTGAPDWRSELVEVSLAWR